MYVFVCITRLTSWVASKQPQMWAYTPPTKSSKQSSEWIVFARVPTCYATRHCRRRCCRRISSLSFLITPQFAMLDLHTTRFIHDHDSSWHDKLIRRRSIWRIRCLVRTPLSLSHCSMPRRSVCVIFKSSRILSKLLRFVLSLLLPVCLFFSLSCLCFIEVRLICFFVVVGVLAFVVILFILCAQVLTPFRRSLITHNVLKNCLFSLVLFLLSWCVCLHIILILVVMFCLFI